MSSFFTPKSSKRKRTTRIQFAALTAALLLALVVLPVSAGHWEEIDYIDAYEEAESAAAIDAGSARLAALGKHHTAQKLEASYEASTARYAALASLYGLAGGVAIAQDAAILASNPELKSFAASVVADSEFYAENPEAKYALGWSGGSTVAASSDAGSENPELSAFQQYCSC